VTKTRPSPTVLLSTRRRDLSSLASPNSRSPAPTTTGNTNNRSSLTRSCSIRVAQADSWRIRRCPPRVSRRTATGCSDPFKTPRTPFRKRCWPPGKATRANGQPAFGAYVRAPDGSRHGAGLFVLALRRPNLRHDPLRERCVPPVRATAIAPEPVTRPTVIRRCQARSSSHRLAVVTTSPPRPPSRWPIPVSGPNRPALRPAVRSHSGIVDGRSNRTEGVGCAAGDERLGPFEPRRRGVAAEGQELPALIPVARLRGGSAGSATRSASLWPRRDRSVLNQGMSLAVNPLRAEGLAGRTASSRHNRTRGRVQSEAPG
jgi:hypothetical protein